jgi:hypothetical protein
MTLCIGIGLTAQDIAATLRIGVAAIQQALRDGT